jgi:hypothetical protein
MALGNDNRPGYHHMPEYMVAGIPWVTSSIVSGIQKYEFGTVTRTITVKNVAGAPNIKVAFTQNGLSTNYFELQTGESISDQLRVTELYVSGSGNTVSVLAGVTAIPQGYAPILSASRGIPGVG